MKCGWAWRPLLPLPRLRGLCEVVVLDGTGRSGTCQACRADLAEIRDCTVRATGGCVPAKRPGCWRSVSPDVSVSICVRAYQAGWCLSSGPCGIAVRYGSGALANPAGARGHDSRDDQPVQARRRRSRCRDPLCSCLGAVPSLACRLILVKSPVRAGLVGGTRTTLRHPVVLVKSYPVRPGQVGLWAQGRPPGWGPGSGVCAARRQARACVCSGVQRRHRMCVCPRARQVHRGRQVCTQGGILPPPRARSARNAPPPSCTGFRYFLGSDPRQNRPVTGL